MSHTIPFHEGKYKPTNDVIKGNSTALDPVEFSICPAAGPDLARLKSLLFADTHLVLNHQWSPEVALATEEAFKHGGGVFDNTVEAVTGLSVPAAMALKVGVITELPKVKTEGGGMVDDRQAKIPILDGKAFSKVAVYWPALQMKVALAIMKLSDTADKASDQRFFEPRSGSGGTGTRKTRRSSARDARKAHAGKGTAGVQ